MESRQDHETEEEDPADGLNETENFHHGDRKISLDPMTANVLPLSHVPSTSHIPLSTHALSATHISLPSHVPSVIPDSHPSYVQSSFTTTRHAPSAIHNSPPGHILSAIHDSPPGHIPSAIHDSPPRHLPRSFSPLSLVPSHKLSVDDIANQGSISGNVRLCSPSKVGRLDQNFSVDTPFRNSFSSSLSIHEFQEEEEENPLPQRKYAARKKLHPL